MEMAKNPYQPHRCGRRGHRAHQHVAVAESWPDLVAYRRCASGGEPAVALPRHASPTLVDLSPGASCVRRRSVPLASVAENAGCPGHQPPGRDRSVLRVPVDLIAAVPLARRTPSDDDEWRRPERTPSNPFQKPAGWDPRGSRRKLGQNHPILLRRTARGGGQRKVDDQPERTSSAACWLTCTWTSAAPVAQLIISSCSSASGWCWRCCGEKIARCSAEQPPARRACQPGRPGWCDEGPRPAARITAGVRADHVYLSDHWLNTGADRPASAPR